MFQYGVKENGLPRRCAPHDGGIPRFINLPPSPFRGNDMVILGPARRFLRLMQGAGLFYCFSLRSGDFFGAACLIKYCCSVNGEPLEGMKAVYDWEHESMIGDMADVKRPHELYRG